MNELTDIQKLKLDEILQIDLERALRDTDHQARWRAEQEETMKMRRADFAMRKSTTGICVAELLVLIFWAAAWWMRSAA